MNLSNYGILIEILDELRQEYNLLQLLIEENLVKIQEADAYLQSFLASDDSELKMFSPRTIEDTHKEEINKTKFSKKILQDQLNQYTQKQNLLHSRITNLESIIKSEEEYYISSALRKKNLAMLSIQEQDRQRIARDLHDTSLQNLTHLIHKIELSSLYIDQDSVRAKLELSAVNQRLRKIIDEIRNTIFDLRPMTFDDLGLKSAIENLVEVINENKKYKIDMEIENPFCEDDVILVAIYRIVQECLTNIDKHAQASKIIFHAKNKDDYFFIDIEDDGIGFSEKDIEGKLNHHFGMTVMNERVSLLGGKISIHSDKGNGTRINIEVPMT